MRYTSWHKADSRGRILKAAAQQIRARGPHGVGVAGVMSAAGLTHGAFYAHFDSKDGLVAEAVSEMFTDAARRTGGLAGLAALEGDELRAGLRAYLEGYLSAAHRDRPDRGCPMPTLAADIARATDDARRNFAAGFDRLTARLAEALARMGRDRPDTDARATVAQMVGAVALARAMGTGAQSDAILRDSLAAIAGRLGL